MRIFSLKKVNRKKRLKYLKFGGIGVLVGLPLLGILLILMVRIGVFGSLPPVSELKSIKNNNASEVYAADGVLLGKYYFENRTNVDRDNIAPAVLDALVATEDVRFYQHNGIDARSLARVFFKSILLMDRSSGGGSTITQQLAKNLYPRQNYWLLSMPVNKIREVMIARRLEEAYSKQEIIIMYLNTVPFGGNVYGIEAASQRFFNKSSAHLQVEEAAVLVGMLKATTSYNPRLYADRSKGRRDVVLSQMEKYGFLAEEASDSLQQLPLTIDYHYVSHNQGLAPYFREKLRVEIDQWLKTHPKEDGTYYNLYTDGLKIHTSIDSRLQEYAEAAMTSQMKKLQKTFLDHWNGKQPWGENEEMLNLAIRQSKRYKAMVQAGKTEEEIKEAFNTPIPMTVYSWEGEVEKTMSPKDSIIYHQSFLNAGFLAMEPKTGLIRAWVGGINHEHFKYDHVTARRQVGSTFKPIVYAAALENGVDPCEYISNELVEYADYKNWTPRNANNEYEGFYSMQGGLTHSVNTISVKLILETGVDKAVDLAEKMHISSVPKEPSIALGTADISLYEMVAAYGVFANRGYYVEPVYLFGIKDQNGNMIKDFTKEQKIEPVMSRETADMMVQMMKSVVDSGSASRIRYAYGLRNDIAGKTGTTQSQADGWFIGMLPNLVAGSWVGGDNRLVRFRTTSLGQGANTALPIWANFMTSINKDKRFTKARDARFPQPSSAVLRNLDCPMFKPEEEPGLLERIFAGSKKDKDKDDEGQEPEEVKTVRRSDKKEEKKKFFDFVKDIFKKN